MIINKNKKIIIVLCVIQLLTSIFYITYWNVIPFFLEVALVIGMIVAVCSNYTQKTLGIMLVALSALNAISNMVLLVSHRLVESNAWYIIDVVVYIGYIVVGIAILNSKKIIAEIFVACVFALYIVQTIVRLSSDYNSSSIIASEFHRIIVCIVLMVMILSATFLNSEKVRKNEKLAMRTTAQSIEEKMIELKRMYEEGEISQETYEAERRKILKEL